MEKEPKDSIKLSGRMFGRLIQNGKIEEFEIKNLTCNVGLDFLCNYLADGGQDQMSYIAVGTGSGQGITDQTLATELTRKGFDNGFPTSTSFAVVGGSSVWPVVRYRTTFNPGEATGTLTEAGVFNAAVSGVMLAYVSDFSINKLPTGVFEVTWEIELRRP